MSGSANPRRSGDQRRSRSTLKPTRAIQLALHGWSARRPAADLDAVTVITPMTDKDLPVAPHWVDSVRQHLAHPIDRVVVVSPRSPAIEAFCRDFGVEHVDEADMLARHPTDIGADAAERRGAGWLRQQQFKLMACEYLDADRVVTIDADTVLIRPVGFQDRRRRAVFYWIGHNRRMMRRLTESLIGPTRNRVSFKAHVMMFERDLVRRMTDRIADRAGADWITAIRDAIRRFPECSLSEFDLYGSYVHTYVRERAASAWWFNQEADLGEVVRWRDPPENLRSYTFLSCHNPTPSPRARV